MRRIIHLGALAGLTVALIAGSAGAQDIGPADPGVRTNAKGVAPGYVLLAPLEQQYTYLVTPEGRVAKTWRTTTRPGLSQQLTPKGELVRGADLERRGPFANGQGAGGRIEALSWTGETLWQKDIADETQMQHHEIEVLPNGNVLAIVWERLTEAEALAVGRDPKLLKDHEIWPDKIIEYDPVADAVVWQWRSWDHLVQDRDPAKPNYAKNVSTRPERIDVNFVTNPDNPLADWEHVNGVAYSAERDEVVISSRSFSEFWVIDHATTTADAAGPAGDLKFRYGNPAAYGDKKGKRQLFFQHDSEWIPPGAAGEGHITVFNNGAPDIREYSSADEIIPTLDENGEYVQSDAGGFEAKIKRIYPLSRDDDKGEFAAIISSVQRLPNGNTLIGYGPQGHVIEVTSNGKVVWDYVNPYLGVRPTSPRNSGAGFPIQPNWFFQVDKYPPSYPAFEGHEQELAPPPKPSGG